MSLQMDYDPSALRRRVQAPTVAIDLAARLVLPGGRDHPGRIVAASTDEMAISAPLAPRYGDHVVVHTAELGRLDGDVERLTDNGFAITLELVEAPRRRLAAQLIWHANRERCGLVEARRHTRFIPQMPWTRVRMPDGAEQFARIQDLSLAGVRVEAAVGVGIGDRVAFGVKAAIVGRVFDGGFVAKFEEPFAEGELSEATRL